MFEQLSGSSRRDDASATWVALPVSSALHLAVFGALIAASYLAVGSIQEPRSGLIFILPPPPPPIGMAAPLLLRGAVKKQPEVEKKVVPPEKLPPMIQPEKPPEHLPPPDPDPTPGDDAGVDNGDANGLLDGVPGGHPGGIPHGDPNGVPGGLPNGVLASLGELPGNDEPIRLVGDVRPPELLVRINPDYPELARTSKVEGKVILEIVVGRSGEVEEVKVLRSHPLFDAAATEAVRRWKYAPALQSGRPVKVYITVVVDFRLK